GLRERRCGRVRAVRQRPRRRARSCEEPDRELRSPGGPEGPGASTEHAGGTIRISHGGGPETGSVGCRRTSRSEPDCGRGQESRQQPEAVGPPAARSYRVGTARSRQVAGPEPHPGLEKQAAGGEQPPQLSNLEVLVAEQAPTHELRRTTGAPRGPGGDAAGH